MTARNGEIWIGLAELHGPPENEILQGSSGAYANYIVVVDNETEFLLAAEESAREIGLLVKEIQWCYPLSTRIKEYDVETSLVELAEEAARTGEGYFHTFHTWDSDG